MEHSYIQTTCRSSKPRFLIHHDVTVTLMYLELEIKVERKIFTVQRDPRRMRRQANAKFRRIRENGDPGRAVSITRALIKYLLVRGISTRAHDRHQSSQLDVDVHPSAMDNPEAAGFHRSRCYPTSSLPWKMHREASAHDATCTGRFGPPIVSEICDPTRGCTQTADWYYVWAGPGGSLAFPPLVCQRELKLRVFAAKWEGKEKRWESLKK